MITIKFLDRISGLPFKGKSVLIVFTDTVFGWLKPGMTDENGIVAVQSGPGPARVYVDGEFFGSQRLGGDMLAFLDEDGSASWDKEDIALVDFVQQQVPMETEDQAFSKEITAREREPDRQVRA